MILKENIIKELVETKSETFELDFVAAAAVIKDGQAQHAGLVISHDRKGYFLHFNTKEVLLGELKLSDIPEMVHKSISVINPSLIPAFLVHCRLIVGSASPRYGFFYSGSYYKDGVYFSEKGMPEFMTCVGFCLGVLKGFIEENEYIAEEDWGASTEKAEVYFEDFIIQFQKDYSHIQVSDLRKTLRRIKPSEFISTAYLTAVPIRKAQVDKFSPIIEDHLKSK